MISIDYRGRGGSDWDPTGSHDSFAWNSAIFLAVLDQLGVTSAIFIGLSRGGLHALSLVSLRPGLVKALVLNDVGPALNRLGLLNIKNYIGRLPVLRDLDEAVAHYKRAMGARFPAVPDEHWRYYAAFSLDTTRERMRLSHDPQAPRGPSIHSIRKNPCPTCGRSSPR